MSKEAQVQEKSELEKALDESLDELQKAAEGDESISKAAEEEKKEEEEAKGEKPAFLKKKGEKDEDEKDEDEDAKGDKKEEEEAKGEKKDEEKKEDEDAKGEKDEDEEAMRGGYRKSVEETIAKSESVSNAIEVSKFLRELVKSQADVLGDVLFRVRKLEKSNKVLADALVKSQKAQGEFIKSLGADVATLGKAPLPRKSIPSGATIEKSFRNNEGADENKLTKSQVSSRLAELECTMKVPMGTTTRYEMTGELSKSHEKLVMEFEK